MAAASHQSRYPPPTDDAPDSLEASAGGSARTDRAPCASYVELHGASAYSFRRAGSSVEALVERAAALGMSALALTDHMTLAGMVRFQAICARHGVRAVGGVEVAVVDPVFGDAARPAHLVALAENAVGYARLCRLLTNANLAHPEAPIIPFAALAQQNEGLIVLTGGREGTLARLLLARRRLEAEAVARRYREAFGANRVFIELQHHRLPESTWLMQQLVWIAEAVGLRVVATNEVRYATREDYRLYDLVTCSRLGITVDEAHGERPRNDEAFLKSGEEMADLLTRFPWGHEALATSVEIADRCHLSLLRGVCTAPRVPLPAEQTPSSALRRLCEEGLVTRFAQVSDACAEGSRPRRQLEHELAVIEQLELEEFFLCVHDIVRQARQSGIRISGRGSAANSLVAYLLGITGVDPLRHKLLFERFLNPDRRGMPDIDLDVASDRRDELIRYVEQTYSPEHAAMVANTITYQPRSALRDTAKALGYPLALINCLTKVLPHHAGPMELPRYADELAEVVATLPDAVRRERCRKRLPLLVDLAARLCGLPRHLSLHNGGLVFSRQPLIDVLPIRRSSNGVRALEVNKDDVEQLGLIKFDLLGLRTLSAIEEALALIEETTGTRPDVDHLPTEPPDAPTMRLIRSGQTVAIFQLESPGQWHLLSETQPTSFDDLIIQTALFRPGPLLGGFVRPYVARRQEMLSRRGDSAAQPAQPAYPAPPVHPGRNALTPVPTSTPTATATTASTGAAAATAAPGTDVAGTGAAGGTGDLWRTHPVLAPIVADTQGILLFQEQILLVAHDYAGLSYAAADGFRRAMSHYRTQSEMEAMRARFVAGAAARGEPVAEATAVFEAISQYVGYGFCRSHAAEFAKCIYTTAYLKARFPAHYLAAFLSVQPCGYFPPHVVVEEAKRLKIPVLGVDINRSEDRFSVEWVGSERVGSPPGRWAVRIGLRQVAQVGDDMAEAILWERRGRGGSGTGSERPFLSLADFCQRLRPAGLTWPAAEALVLVGAFDGLRPGIDRRRRLWQLHELWPLVSPQRAKRRSKRAKGGEAEPEEELEQLAFEWTLAPEDTGLLPALPYVDLEERLALDYQLLGLSARPHPVRLQRRELRRRGVRTIAELAEVPAGQVVRVAGWPISAQRPPTARGMGFLVIEDESGRLPIALPPRLADQMRRVIRSARIMLVVGRVERIRWYRSVLGFELEGIA